MTNIGKDKGRDKKGKQSFRVGACRDMHYIKEQRKTLTHVRHAGTAPEPKKKNDEQTAKPVDSPLDGERTSQKEQKKQKRLAMWQAALYREVGAEGFEPPTLCL